MHLDDQHKRASQVECYAFESLLRDLMPKIIWCHLLKITFIKLDILELYILMISEPTFNDAFGVIDLPISLGGKMDVIFEDPIYC